MKRGASAKTTHLLNVDLDLYSRSNLQPLVSALGDQVFVLFVGRVRRTYEAHLEMPPRPRTSADWAVLGFCKLIESLPRASRDLWNRSTRRDFNIGVQCGVEPHAHETQLSAQAVAAASKVGARILMTVYAPEDETAASKRTRPAKKAGRTPNVSFR